MTTTQWRAPARLAVSGPEGWAAAERLEVHHRDGDALVCVEAWPVRLGAEVDEFALAHSVRRLGQQDDADPLVPDVVMGHEDGRRGTACWTDENGRAMRTTIGYALHDGRMVALTEVAPIDDPGKAADIAAILASVSIAGPTAIDEERLPLRDLGVDLTVIGPEWLRGAAPGTPAEHVITTDESFGAARHFGVVMLPGVDGGAWGQLDDAQRELASAVAWRSLAARGATDEDSPLREALEIAVSHDFLMVVNEHRADGGQTEQRYAARPDRMVCVQPGPVAGTIRLATYDTGAFADLVLGLDPGFGVSVSCVYRSEGRVVGHETAWDRDATEAEVRAALVGLLPEVQAP